MDINVKQENVSEYDDENVNTEFWINSKGFMKHELVEQEGILKLDNIYQEREANKELSRNHQMPEFVDVNTAEYKYNPKTDLDINVEQVKLLDTFSCTMCNFQTYSKFDLERHSYIHGTGKLFKCNLCDFHSKGRAILKSHFSKCHDDKAELRCTMCDYKAFSKRHLSFHLKIHTGSTKMEYVCDVCPFKSFHKHNYNRHVANHSKEIKVYCELCKYKTNSNYNLKVHMLRVHREATFQCYHCDFKTPNKCVLRIHVFNHREDRYHCLVCDFIAKNRKHFREHKRSHRIKDKNNVPHKNTLGS